MSNLQAGGGATCLADLQNHITRVGRAWVVLIGKVSGLFQRLEDKVETDRPANTKKDEACVAEYKKVLQNKARLQKRKHRI